MSGVERQLHGWETRIAEETTSVLDYLSRVQSALEEGSWRYAWEKSLDLHRVAGRLAKVLEFELEEKRASKRARPRFVIAAIAQFARHYRAGRALFPRGGDPAAAAVRAALDSTAASIEFNPPEGLTPQVAQLVATALRNYPAGGGE